MRKYIVYFSATDYIFVWAPTLEYMGEKFPNANIFDWDNLSVRLIRFEIEPAPPVNVDDPRNGATLVFVE